MKKIISLFLIPCLSILCLFPGSLFAGEAEDAVLSIEAPSAILMEASTGTILYEKNSHEQRRPASVTKVMTLLLIFEALEQGQIQKSDVVTVSEHAASMGGSQVYLEAGETQTVEDLIKCISIASANDACVAMAEFISGSEEAFVEKMNEKAKTLGMNDTTFRNCCGLEAEGHLTSAYDIALMSRELSEKHPDIYNYCTIWMDTIIHTTRRGSEEFGLTNTNKLLRYYSYATGLKTGYTSQSGYCLSATAEKDDVHLIAVVMAEESPTVRNKDAVALLNYGFANCTLYTDENSDPLPSLPVKKGTADNVSLSYENSFSAVLLKGADPLSVEKTFVLPEEATAPIESGQEAGKVVYTLNNEEIGSVRILYADSVPALTYRDCFIDVLLNYFLYG
jgi:D-alanyl-D-alanine carboxypeptidase (penicillin-binding protein 5/6)